MGIISLKCNISDTVSLKQTEQKKSNDHFVCTFSVRKCNPLSYRRMDKSFDVLLQCSFSSGGKLKTTMQFGTNGSHVSSTPPVFIVRSDAPNGGVEDTGIIALEASL